MVKMVKLVFTISQWCN